MSTTQATGTGRHVVVAGAGFAGLGAAFRLRRRLDTADRVTVIDPNGMFLFKPSLVAAALGRQPVRASFAVEPVLKAHGIDFIRSAVHGVDARAKRIVAGEVEIAFNKLVIATGGRPDAGDIAGAAGEFRATHFIVGEASAEDVRGLILQVTREPGPVVVGSVRGASYVSAMYELVLGLDSLLRASGNRDTVPITFVTGEPYLGHLGFGQTALREKLERRFRELGIEFRTDVSVRRVGPGEVELDSDETLSASASFLMPALSGDVDIWKSAGLTDERGLISVDDHYRHVNFADIFAAGVASVFANPVSTLGGRPAPHTGYLSVRMGRIAAENVAAELGRGSPASRTLPWLLDLRVLEAPDRGWLLASYGSGELKHRAVPLPGRSSTWLKIASERYVTRRLRMGR